MITIKIEGHNYTINNIRIDSDTPSIVMHVLTDPLLLSAYEAEHHPFLGHKISIPVDEVFTLGGFQSLQSLIKTARKHIIEYYGEAHNNRVAVKMYRESNLA